MGFFCGATGAMVAAACSVAISCHGPTESIITFRMCPFRGTGSQNKCLPISIELGKNIEFRLCVLRQANPPKSRSHHSNGGSWQTLGLANPKITLHALQSSFMGTVMFVFISGACGFLARAYARHFSSPRLSISGRAKLKSSALFSYEGNRRTCSISKNT